MGGHEVEAFISASVARLVQHARFVDWRPNDLGPDELIVVNNSFVFRDVRTNKADKYLALTLRDEASEPEIRIAHGLRFNLEFKRFPSSPKSQPTTTSLAKEVPSQLANLEDVIFLLVGELLDTEIVDVPLNHSAFSRVVWDPTASEIANVRDENIVVSRTDDEDKVWMAISDHLEVDGAGVPAGLRDALGVALDQLQDQAVALVRIPKAGEQVSVGITDSIVTVLREQRDEYENAVSTLDATGSRLKSGLSDVLRLSYNFASDATGYLRLIVSICDLKPIVLWGTISEHFRLSSAFDRLPWARSKRKPSLKNYQHAIADARNSAFHNLFPFRKSLIVPLPDTAMGAPQLQIFSEHAKKSSNQILYRDKELVDVLVEFTRARERNLPTVFWQKNLEVMNATIELFERTSEFIKILGATKTESKNRYYSSDVE